MQYVHSALVCFFTSKAQRIIKSINVSNHLILPYILAKSSSSEYPPFIRLRKSCILNVIQPLQKWMQARIYMENVSKQNVHWIMNQQHKEQHWFIHSLNSCACCMDRVECRTEQCQCWRKRERERETRQMSERMDRERECAVSLGTCERVHKINSRRFGSRLYKN